MYSDAFCKMKPRWSLCQTSNYTLCSKGQSDVLWHICYPWSVASPVASDQVRAHLSTPIQPVGTGIARPRTISVLKYVVLELHMVGLRLPADNYEVRKIVLW